MRSYRAQVATTQNIEARSCPTRPPLCRATWGRSWKWSQTLFVSRVSLASAATTLWHTPLQEWEETQYKYFVCVLKSIFQVSILWVCFFSQVFTSKWFTYYLLQLLLLEVEPFTRTAENDPDGHARPPASSVQIILSQLFHFCKTVKECLFYERQKIRWRKLKNFPQFCAPFTIIYQYNTCEMHQWWLTLSHLTRSK